MLAVLMCICMSGCSKKQYITNKELDGTWYCTIASSGTLTFELDEKTYSSTNSFGEGQYRLQKGSCTIVLKDASGETQVIVAKKNEDNAWILVFENPYFPLTFTRTPPANDESVGQGAESNITNSDFDELSFYGETIIELLNVGEWVCDGADKKLAFTGNTISVNGGDFETFLFTSIQLDGLTSHFTATYPGGSIIGRLTQAYSENAYEGIPDIFYLDILINGQEYICATLHLPIS